MTHLTPHPRDPDVKARRREDRKVWRNALMASLLVHGLVFLVWGYRSVPLSPFAAAGDPERDARAAGGSMQAIDVRTPPSTPLVPPPVPVPTLEEVEPLEFDEVPEVEQAAVSGVGVSDLQGPGTAQGTGRGDGGDAAEGLNRMVPPTPRGMIIPPMSDELKGAQIEVWVFVDEGGRVVADSTRLNPPTSNRRFNQRLIEEAAEWIFVPARRGGEPIATWFPYTISMQRNPVSPTRPPER